MEDNLPLVHFLSFSLSVCLYLSLALSHVSILMYVVCVPVDVSLCVHKCICAFIRVRVFYSICVCVDVCLFVIDGALSPFPQLGPAG